MKKRGIIFDMDGTLWDSAQAVAASWAEVVSDYYKGKKIVTAQDIQRVMGLTMDKLAAALFPELLESERMELLQKCCQAENAWLAKHGGILYEGLEPVLQTLYEAYPLYIVSNCQSGYIEAFLTYYKYEKYFQDIECYGNNGLEKSDNIINIVNRNGLNDAIYVGDIQGDYDASKKAGVRFIHAAYGFGSISERVFKIDSLKELPDRVLQIFSEDELM